MRKLFAIGAWVVLFSFIALQLSALRTPVIPTAAPIIVVPSTEDIRTEAVRLGAKKAGVDTVMLLQISRQENYRGIRDAWSHNDCCVGIMQVNVRVWYGMFDKECGGSDLLDPYENACYGAFIYKDALRMCRNRERCALRVYHLGPKGLASTATGENYVQLVMSRPGI